MNKVGEKYGFLAVGLVCAVFFLYGLPRLLNQNHSESPHSVSKDSSPTAEEMIGSVEVNEEPTLSVVGIQGIQVKASGDDPIDEGFVSQPLDLRKEFDHRFSEDEFYSESSSYDFSVPEGLRNLVNFWVQVFGKYGKGVYLFHHKDTVELFYSVVDLRDLDPEKSGLTPAQAESLKNKALIEEKKRLQVYLTSLSRKIKNHEILDVEEEKMARLFAKNPLVSIDDAAILSNIRIQGGFAHRFKQAIITSGLYMKEMERIFREKNLPVELTRLPLVESAFNIKAVSSAAAGGLWQFIPETGARYLKIDEFTDERMDPIYSTYAAAAHLKSEYNLIGNWPLTINAYNTGPGRVMRAMKQLGTDSIERIIREFKDPAYQFYSRNYYPEFLAALQVYNNQFSYFGRLNILSPFRYEVYSPSREIDLADLADLADLDPQTLKDYNPALSAAVLSGDKKLPADYLVKVPPNMGIAMAQAETLLREDVKTGSSWYLAEAGDTLENIAAKFNLPVILLEKINSYLPKESLKAGTFIELPAQEDVAQVPGQTAIP